MASRITVEPKRIYHSKSRGLPKINVGCNKDTERTQAFLSCLQNIDPTVSTQLADDRWAQLSSAIHTSAIAAYGKAEKQSTDWYDANASVMEDATTAKRQALLHYKNTPSQDNLDRLRQARAASQKLARQCANNYWLKLCTVIEDASKWGTMKVLYKQLDRYQKDGAHKVEYGRDHHRQTQAAGTLDQKLS